MWFWKKKFVPFLHDGKYRVVEAFIHNGTRYLMFENSVDVPMGRMLAALAIYNEMEMRCDREYLDAHCRAMEKLLSDPKKISLNYIVQLNINLKERLELMPLPDFVYKLASVIFFNESESRYAYDFEYNKKKIEAWKKEPEMLDFFLSRLASDLIPSLKSAAKSSKTYFQVAERIDQIHRQNLTKVLSGNI